MQNIELPIETMNSQKRIDLPSEYEQHLSTMKHYSDIIFKTRVYIASASVFVWGFMLNLNVGGIPEAYRAYCLPMAAGLASVMLSLLTHMENLYVRMYLYAMVAGLRYELNTNRHGIFKDYQGPLWLQFHIFYLSNVVALIIASILLLYMAIIPEISFLLILVFVYASAFGIILKSIATVYGMRKKYIAEKGMLLAANLEGR